MPPCRMPRAVGENLCKASAKLAVPKRDEVQPFAWAGPHIAGRWQRRGLAHAAGAGGGEKISCPTL